MTATRLFVLHVLFAGKPHKLLSGANKQAGTVEVLLVNERSPSRTHSLPLTAEQARSFAGSLLYFANLLEGGEGPQTLQLLPPGDIMASLTTVTKDQIMNVLIEYDRKGEEAFLSQHGFRKGRFMLVYRGKLYHSKAVFGVAMGKSAAEFSGGSAHVQRAAERLGLNVVEVAS